MELAHCIRCEKVYAKLRLSVCPTCEVLEEKEIFEVQRYLRDHSNSSLIEVSDALNIYLEDIDRWIDEERLRVAVTSRAARECGLCGEPIPSGRICKACQKRLGLMTEEVIREEEALLRSTAREVLPRQRMGGGDSNIRKFQRG